MIEKQILKSLLKTSTYHLISVLLDEDMFDGDLVLVYNTIVDAHKKYTTDLDIAWVKELLHTKYPAMSVSRSKGIAILCDDIAHEGDIPDDLLADLVRSMNTKLKARRIAAEAIKVVNGESDSLTTILSALDDIEREEVDGSGRIDPVKFDLDGFLKGTSIEGLHRFRLQTFRDNVYGAGPGNFIIVFGRPESGKTGWAAYETAGWIMNGLKVAYFGNEEPAFRTYLRIVCSALEVDVDHLRANKKEAEKSFALYSDNLSMFDCVGLSIDFIDLWAKEHKPDIIVCDQLDKVTIKQRYARTDEELGAKYNMAREIAKRRGCVFMGVTQASADGEGLAQIDFSMMAGSKTAKAAEADLVIGIGHNSSIHDNFVRQLNVSKNKINGWHGAVVCNIDPRRTMYIP